MLTPSTILNPSLSQGTPERFDVVVVGGGQAGLAAGYHLARRGLGIVILDPHDHVGDAWRNRWDPLQLFTPAGITGLPGMPFPGPRHAFPTKDQVADYLGNYAEMMNLPVRTGVEARLVSRKPPSWLERRDDRPTRWRPTPSSSLQAGTSFRGSRHGPASSTRRSCSCTRWHTGIRRNSSPVRS